MTIQNDIATKLITVNSSLSDIKDAIIEKGVTPTGDITTYAAAIGSISGGGTLESVTVAPSTTAQTITPPSGVDGFDEISVNAVTAAIDSDIQAGNIKSGVEILGVTGTYTGEGANLQSKTLTVDGTTPTVSTVAPDSGYDGLSSVTVDMTYVEDRLDTLLGTSVVPTGTLSITANGVYDVTNYASANVSVSGGGSVTLYRWQTNDPTERSSDGWLTEESYIWYTTTDSPIVGDIAYAQYIKMTVRDYSSSNPGPMGGDISGLDSPYLITKWYVGSVSNVEKYGRGTPVPVSYTFTCQDENQNTITKTVSNDGIIQILPKEQIYLSS